MSPERLSANNSSATDRITTGDPLPSAPALELDGVTKTFGDGSNKVQALGPISFAIESGSFVSVVGPSGCGKSTLLRLMAGLEQPTVGKLRRYGAKSVSSFKTMSFFRGRPCWKMSYFRRKCYRCRRRRRGSARYGCWP